MSNEFLNGLQAASNAVAGNVAGPVDILAFLLRKAGMPVPENAIGGSNWMTQKGLMAPVRQGASQVIGETAGLLGPAMVSQFGPQIARGLLKGGENLASPRTLNPQRGVVAMPDGARRMEIAQRNAAKPVSEGGLGLGPNNTAQERAKALGFDTEMFHGQTGMSLSERGPLTHIARDIGKAEEGALFGAGPNLASRYAKDRDWIGQGGAVYPLQVRSSELVKSGYPMPSNAELEKMSPKQIEKLIDDIDAWNNKVDKVGIFQKGIGTARATGKDGAVFTQMVDAPSWTDARSEIPQDIYGMLSGVRSRFAAFDPARRNEADLLGGADPYLLALLGLGAGGAAWYGQD